MGIRDARKRVERILEGKEDERLFGNREEEKDRLVVEEVDEEKGEKQEWYGLHLLPEVPGMEIVESLGIVHVFSEPGNFFHNLTDENDIKRAWLRLREKALFKGANAVVNARIVFPMDITAGTGAILIYVYGEAVIVRPKGSRPSSG